MKIIAKKANVASTAVQHVAKHFDLVLGHQSLDLAVI